MVSDGARAPNINPSNTGDVVGQYPRAARVRKPSAAIAAAKAAFPAWSRSRRRKRATTS